MNTEIIRHRFVHFAGSLTLLVSLSLVPCLRGAQVQETQLSLTESKINIRGTELFYRTGGNGPPVLLIHGFTLTGHVWLPFLDELGKHYTLIVPDLPGHGKSSWLPGEFSYYETANAMFVLLDALKIDRVKAIGHSAGANTLVHMAIQQPSRVEAMVLVAGAHRLTNGAREVISQFRFENMGEAIQTYYRKYHTGGEQQISSIMARLRAIANNYKDFAFSPEHLGLIKARTLLVWGDRDPIYPVEIGFEMYRSIKNAAFWIVPDRGHSPIWEWLDGSPEAAAIFPAVVREYFEKK